jgi:hypothetical protein
MHTNGSHAYEDEPLDERSTKDLVEELVTHGRHLIEAEIAGLRAQLQSELGRVRDDARATGTSMVEQARERMTSNVSALRADLVEQGQRAKDAAKPLATGGVLLHAGLFFLLGALVLGLGTLMPLWVSALIVGVAVAAIGGALLASGKRKAETVGKNALERTNNQLRESKRWIERSKETVAEMIRDLKSTLSGVELPRLRPSSGAGRIRTTSATRLEAP